jgi:hypothetical protein
MVQINVLIKVKNFFLLGYSYWRKAQHTPAININILVVVIFLSEGEKG